MNTALGLTHDPLFLRRGDNWEHRFAVTTADGVALDITGATFRFMVKARIDDVDGSALVTATTANGKCVITSAVAGLMEVRLVAADTDALVPARAVWDLQARDGTSKVWTVAAGFLHVQPDISRTVP